MQYKRILINKEEDKDQRRSKLLDVKLIRSPLTGRMIGTGEFCVPQCALRNGTIFHEGVTLEEGEDFEITGARMH